MKKVLVLGVGNTLLGDEGFGVHALNMLREKYSWPENTRLVDGATGGLMLMADLMDCDFACVLDVVMLGQKPGTICLIEDGDIGKDPTLGQSLHQTGIANILSCCELAGHRPETIIIGIEPWDCETVQASLTPDAEQILSIYCEKVAQELRKRSIAVNMKE